MIDIKKWDNALCEDKLKFVEGLMSLSDTNCISKADWETMCRFMLDEVKSCKLILDEYANKTEKQRQIIQEPKARELINEKFRMSEVRLIDANALKKDFIETINAQGFMTTEEIISKIDNAPTVAPEKALIDKLKGGEENDR